ncbi:MAG: DNA-deoxyinosine glycosylase [Oscillospiraceae bacterium]|jgi:hypoxanthine-DNA glycosylase|nr:DNA-deoxyinosine glycosylase [Oscillospiraceae bacterium]
MRNCKTLFHPFPPVFDARSRVLILGTFPSPRSRETGFYYGHPQNAFWRTLARVLDVPEPAPDAPAKTAFLLKNRVAVWDVLRSCEIDGAADDSIRNPVPNEFRPIIEKSEIRAVFTTGKKATELWGSLASHESGMTAIYLPSTSPANRGRHNTAEFWERWSRLRRYL